MNINDLQVCEVVEFDNQIVGGLTADVKGEAIAAPGIAFADVNAEAIGLNTIVKVGSSADVAPYYSSALYHGYGAAWDNKGYSVDYESDYAYSS